MSELSETGVGTPQTNMPEISVSELATALKRTIEDRFGRVRVRGEISNYRGPHASGHAYFSLKDQNARLDAVDLEVDLLAFAHAAAGGPRSRRDGTHHHPAAWRGWGRGG